MEVMVLLYYVLAALFSRPSMPFLFCVEVCVESWSVLWLCEWQFCVLESVSGLVVPARGEVVQVKSQGRRSLCVGARWTARRR